MRRASMLAEALQLPVEERAKRVTALRAELLAAWDGARGHRALSDAATGSTVASTAARRD